MSAPTVEAHIPPGRLSRLVARAVAGDVRAYNEIESWRRKYPAECEQRCRNWPKLRMLIVDMEGR